MARGIEAATRLPIADRVRLELRAVAIDERLAPQGNRAVALHQHRVCHVSGDAVVFQLEQRVDHGVRRREAAGWSGRETEPARGGGVECAALHPRVGLVARGIAWWPHALRLHPPARSDE